MDADHQFEKGQHNVVHPGPSQSFPRPYLDQDNSNTGRNNLSGIRPNPSCACLENPTSCKNKLIHPSTRHIKLPELIICSADRENSSDFSRVTHSWSAGALFTLGISHIWRLQNSLIFWPLPPLSLSHSHNLPLWLSAIAVSPSPTKFRSYIWMVP